MPRAEAGIGQAIRARLVAPLRGYRISAVQARRAARRRKPSIPRTAAAKPGRVPASAGTGAAFVSDVRDSDVVPYEISNIRLTLFWAAWLNRAFV
jgi:hypothetical protein